MVSSSSTSRVLSAASVSVAQFATEAAKKQTRPQQNVSADIHGGDPAHVRSRRQYDEKMTQLRKKFASESSTDASALEKAKELEAQRLQV